MTDEEMKVKRWLCRAFYADKKIKAVDMLLRTSRMHAEWLVSAGQYNFTGKSDTVLNGTENAYIKVADIERRYTEQKKELIKVTEEISGAIALLHDDDLETVLIHRYLLFHTIEQTAELMNYSPRTIKYKQTQAIKKLCPLLPCFAR